VGVASALMFLLPLAILTVIALILRIEMAGVEVLEILHRKRPYLTPPPHICLMSLPVVPKCGKGQCGNGSLDADPQDSSMQSLSSMHQTNLLSQAELCWSVEVSPRAISPR